MTTDLDISEVRSREELIAWVSSNGDPQYNFFWGHKQRYPDKVDKSCLSNWYPSSFEVEGVRYATSEHYMMAGKALLFEDYHAYETILAARTPEEAKFLGRRVRFFEKEAWERHCMEIVVAGNVAKFSQHEDLKLFLLNTGTEVLVEASPMDRIWGIGLTHNHADARNPSAWLGDNLLGFALMEVRSQLTA